MDTQAGRGAPLGAGPCGGHIGSLPGSAEASPDGLQELGRPLALLTGHPGHVQHGQAETLALLLEAETHVQAPTQQVTAVLGEATAKVSNH